MVHQNLDVILAECPQFVTTMYEFLAFTQYPNQSIMKDLEKVITENNIHNMPSAGLKNFLRAMVRYGAGDKEMISPVVSLLGEKKAYNDLKVNLQTIRFLCDTQVPFDDYLLKSLQAYKTEFDTQKAKGNLAIETDKKIDRTQSNFFMISHFTIGNMFKLVTDYCFLHNITFSEERVAELAEKFPIVDEEGKRTVTGSPSGLEEHIYYQVI